MKKNPPLAFDFQEIDISQIPELIPTAYRSKYEALRLQIIEKILSMPANKSFIFAFSKTQKNTSGLTESMIGNIRNGINKGLKLEHLNWRVAYSQKAKAFVVVPFKRNSRKALGEYKISASPNKIPSSNATGFTKPETERLRELLEITQKHLGISLEELQNKELRQLSAARQAFFYVGRNALGIKLTRLGELLGFASSSSTLACQKAMQNPNAKKQVKILSDALNWRH